MISDDLTAVQGVAGAWVAPGYPSIKLSAESRDWLDLPATGLPAHGQAKTRVEAQLCTEPRRLRRLYLLRPVVGLEEPSILAIAPARAVKVVLAQVYRPGIGVALGRRGAQFQRVVELLRDVDVCLLRRPTDGTLIDTVAKTLEADCLDSSSDHTSRAPSTSR